MGEQRVFLAFNKLTVFAGQSCIFALSHFVQGLVQMPHDMKLIVKDGSLRCMLADGVFKSLPHVHNCKPYFPGFLKPQFFIEEIHAFFRTVFATKPNRSLPLKVAYYDAIDVAFANRNFINTDYLWTWASGTTEFLPHVLFFEFLDGLPVKVQFPGHVFNRLGTAPLADIEGKALGVEWIIRKKLKLLLFHLMATKTINALNLKFDVPAPVTTGKITNLSLLTVLESSVNPVAGSADCFFPCRMSLMTKALESPKIPDTLRCGLKLQNLYAS